MVGVGHRDGGGQFAEMVGRLKNLREGRRGRGGESTGWYFVGHRESIRGYNKPVNKEMNKQTNKFVMGCVMGCVTGCGGVGRGGGI